MVADVLFEEPMTPYMFRSCRECGPGARHAMLTRQAAKAFLKHIDSFVDHVDSCRNWSNKTTEILQRYDGEIYFHLHIICFIT